MSTTSTYYLACETYRPAPVNYKVRLLDGPHHRRVMHTTKHTSEIITEDNAVYHFSDFLTELHGYPIYVWEQSPNMKYTDQ